MFKVCTYDDKLAINYKIGKCTNIHENILLPYHAFCEQHNANWTGTGITTLVTPFSTLIFVYMYVKEDLFFFKREIIRGDFVQYRT